MAAFRGAQNRGFSDLQRIAAECCLWQSTSCCQRHTCRCSQPPTSDKPHKAAHALPVQQRLLQTLWPGSCRCTVRLSPTALQLLEIMSTRGTQPGVYHHGSTRPSSHQHTVALPQGPLTATTPSRAAPTVL